MEKLFSPWHNKKRRSQKRFYLQVHFLRIRRWTQVWLQVAKSYLQGQSNFSLLLFLVWGCRWCSENSLDRLDNLLLTKPRRQYFWICHCWTYTRPRADSRAPVTQHFIHVWFFNSIFIQDFFSSKLILFFFFFYFYFIRLKLEFNKYSFRLMCFGEIFLLKTVNKSINEFLFICVSNRKYNMWRWNAENERDIFSIMIIIISYFMFSNCLYFSRIHIDNFHASHWC